MGSTVKSETQTILTLRTGLNWTQLDSSLSNPARPAGELESSSLARTTQTRQTNCKPDPGRISD